jgi:5-methyltetrahydrofolate--homocysteine methyltransferase
VHTAVKINPNYNRGQTIYVTDASRAVGVVSTLMSQTDRKGYTDTVRAEYIKIREAYVKGESKKTRMSLQAARDNRFAIDWSSTKPVKPTFLGTRNLQGLQAGRAGALHDWTPFLPEHGAAGQISAHPGGQCGRLGSQEAVADDAGPCSKRIVARSG